jgi:hypothetical protein
MSKTTRKSLGRQRERGEKKRQSFFMIAFGIGFVAASNGTVKVPIFVQVLDSLQTTLL